MKITSGVIEMLLAEKQTGSTVSLRISQKVSPLLTYYPYSLKTRSSGKNILF